MPRRISFVLFQKGDLFINIVEGLQACSVQCRNHYMYMAACIMSELFVKKSNSNPKSH